MLPETLILFELFIYGDFIGHHHAFMNEMEESQSVHKQFHHLVSDILSIIFP